MHQLHPGESRPGLTCHGPWGSRPRRTEPQFFLCQGTPGWGCRRPGSLSGPISSGFRGLLGMVRDEMFRILFSLLPAPSP